MKKLSDKKKRIVFEKIFQGNELHTKDAVKFKHGKVPWFVRWKNDKGTVRIASANSDASTYLWPHEQNRVYKIPRKDFVQWLLRNKPFRLGKFFKPWEIRKIIREIVPPVEDL